MLINYQLYVKICESKWSICLIFVLKHQRLQSSKAIIEVAEILGSHATEHFYPNSFNIMHIIGHRNYMV